MWRKVKRHTKKSTKKNIHLSSEFGWNFFESLGTWSNLKAIEKAGKSSGKKRQITISNSTDLAYVKWKITPRWLPRLFRIVLPQSKWKQTFFCGRRVDFGYTQSGHVGKPMKIPFMTKYQIEINEKQWNVCWLPHCGHWPSRIVFSSNPSNNVCAEETNLFIHNKIIICNQMKSHRIYRNSFQGAICRCF